MLTPFFQGLFRLFWASLLVCSLPGFAADLPAIGGAAADHVISREVFRDPSGQMALQQVQSAKFDSVPDIFAGGYTLGAIWMRLVVRPAAEGGPLDLRILPTYLNEVVLYEPSSEAAGSWRSSTTGNRLPWSNRPLASIALGFTIHPVEQTVYYLRLHTATSSILKVEALVPAESKRREMMEVLWQGLYLSIILGICLWVLQNYWPSRERIILIFLGVYAIYLLYLSVIMGHLAPALPRADWLAELTSWLVVLLTFGNFWFHRAFLRLFDIPPVSSWVMNGLVGGGVLAAGMLLAGQAGHALQLANLLGLISAPTMFLVAMSTRRDAPPGRWTVRIFYGILCVALMAFFLPTLGMVSANNRVVYGALLHGLVTALLFGTLLYRRARQLVQDKMDVQRSNERLMFELDREKHKLDEQSRFTAMLSHELKNPLAVIRLNVDVMHKNASSSGKPMQRIDQALETIDDLVERCVLTDQMEQGKALTRQVPVDLRSLLIHWQNPRLGLTQVRMVCEDDLKPVICDPQLLAVAVNNLMDNARKYSPVASVIDVDLRATSSDDGQLGVRLEVANTPGRAGYPDAKHVFDKYYRSPSASIIQGTGLGLYLTKSIVEQLGGFVQYLPQADRIVFRIWLPSS